jgi:hypothetical protein
MSVAQARPNEAVDGFCIRARTPRQTVPPAASSIARAARTACWVYNAGGPDPRCWVRVLQRGLPCGRGRERQCRSRAAPRACHRLTAAEFD